MIYAGGKGVKKDYFEAVNWFKLAAEQGNIKAQSYLGSFYMHGDGVTQDYFKEAEFLRPAAEQGDGLAQLSLGTLLQLGYGVKQNKLEAKYWFGLACDNRLQEGCGSYRELNEAGH